MTYLPRIEIIAGLPRWTSPRTFGDPPGAIPIMLLVVLALFAGMALFHDRARALIACGFRSCAAAPAHTNAFSSEAADPSPTASSWRARGEALIHQEGGEAAGADFAEGGAS